MPRKIPALFLVFVFTITMLASSCGKSIFSSTSTGEVSTNPVTTATPTSSVGPTATPTPTTPALAMATNFNDAEFSVSSRDTKTGTPTLKSQADTADAVHNKWTLGAPMPTALNWPAAGVIKGKLYIVGGYTGGPASADNQVYDIAKNSWTFAAALPAAQAQMAAAVVKNILYVFGGSNDGGATIFNSVYAYNPKADSWSFKSAMPTARCCAVAAVAKNIIYVIGGFNNGNRLSTVEAYNPATDTWTEEEGLIKGKSEISAGVFKSGKSYTIVAAAGLTSFGITGDNEAYDGSTNTWTSLAPDPTLRADACGGALGNSLYLSDGNDTAGNPISVNESFNPTTNIWKSLATTPHAVTDSGFAVYKGKLYCLGGGDFFIPPFNTVYDYVQIYQP